MPVSKTSNTVKIRAQLAMQVLTEKMFREELMRAQQEDNNNNDLSHIKMVLKQNGYSEDFADKVNGINFSELENSNINSIMPDDVDLATVSGTSFNW